MGLLEEILTDIRERQAASELSREGSVMARKPTSQRSLLEDMLYAITGGSPEGFIGGGGILGPIRTQAQKKIAKTLATRAPELMKEVLASKRVMHTAVPGPVDAFAKSVMQPGAKISPLAMEKFISQFPQYKNFGLYQEALNPSFGGTVTIAPTTMRGLNPSGKRTFTTLPDVVKHEATHFLSSPQTRALTNKQAIDVAKALMPELPPHGASVVSNELMKGANESAASEALSYLSESLGKFGSERGASIFKALRPELPVPPPGAKGTAGGISGMGVENLPLYKTMVDLGLIKPENQSLLSDVLESLKQLRGNR